MDNWILSGLMLILYGLNISIDQQINRPTDQQTNITYEIQQAYSRKDIASLRRLHQNSTQRTDQFLAKYRLFPLTNDAALLQNIPQSLPENASAKELALLAGLWSYRIRIDRSTMISAGMRLSGLLDKAKRKNPNDPFYLLIQGQTLFYKPNVFGGSYTQSLQIFRTLRDHLSRNPTAGIDKLEAEVWIWYNLHKTNAPNAAIYKRELLTRNLPALYRDFLHQPPS